MVANIYFRQRYSSLVGACFYRVSVERVDKFVVLSQEMNCFTEVVFFLVVFNIWDCSYAYNVPISEASYRFIQLVLSIHSSESNANLIWLQHGVVIRGDQRRPSSSNPEDCVVHDVILWDPLSVCSNLTLCCPNCLECSGINQSLRASRWKDGRTKCDEPRCLYGLTNNVLLVSRVYVCDRRHQIIAHDPSVLSQVKGILPIPFLLFHKAGVTRELHSFIISHANAGLTISEIQALWLQTMYDSYGSRREAYLSAWNKNSNICPPFPEFDQRFKQPGEKIIASCIARNYFEKEHLYTKRMCQMTARKWLSCDHTFKVSANIGFWFNKRWVKLYDTLFIVLNEEGNVLSWKLCKGTKFSSVENVLQLLKDRLDKQGEEPTIFFLDNCCSWHSKLLKIFPDVTIKLDPFHAIQRVIRKIPKRKGCTETIMQLRRKMILSLRQLFRDPKDRGEQRTMDTPSPDVILENIEMFMRQWSTVEIDSIPLLSSSAIKEINNLKHHVIKGCLSGIPPSGGTNRNEAIHKSLNKSLKRSRIGLELALAFLGLFFYKWNEKKISCKLTNKRNKITYIQPVETYRVISEDSTTDEQFGGSLTIQENAEAADCEFAENLPDIDEAILNCINYLLEKHSDTSSDDGTLSSDDQNCDISDDEDCVNFLDNAQIANVIQQASNFSCLRKYLEDIKGEAPFSRSANDLIHLRNVLCLLTTATNNAQYSGTDLDAFLHLNNLQRIKIPGDGNCFFVSLAIMIQQQLAIGALNAEAKAHMENLGLIKGANTDVKQMATTLRQIIVNEWLANPSSYEPFLSSEQDYEAEANAFLQDGHFASELGNSMPLAASNALRISIVVFNFPVLPICPRDRTLSDHPIYLASDMRFAGHYDGIEQQTTVQQDEEQQRSAPNQCGNQHQITCRCGQGAKRKKNREHFLS